MTVNKIINTRVPHVALQAPIEGSAKKNERFSWQRPLLYTALAVAGLATILFVANGWGSSPTPGTPPKAPTSPKAPTPQPKPNQEPSPPAPAPNANCPQDDYVKYKAFLKAVKSMCSLEEVERYLKNMDPKMTPNAFHDEEFGYIEMGIGFAQKYWDSLRQDCPDLTKVCPVPTTLCVMDQELGDDYEVTQCERINQYVSRILKEDCPKWQLCSGKYCPQTIIQIG